MAQLSQTAQFIVIVILVFLAWNIIQALQNAANNFYLKITNSNLDDIKPWLIIAGIYIAITAIILYLTGFKIDEVLGTTVKFS